MLQIWWFKFLCADLVVLYPVTSFGHNYCIINFALKIQIQKMPIKSETLKIHNLSSVNPNWENLGSKFFSYKSPHNHGLFGHNLIKFEHVSTCFFKGAKKNFLIEIAY